MRKVPIVDLGRCTDCESCLALCPSVFRRHEQTGRIEVAELAEYPEEAVEEAIICCPGNCITWEPVDEARKPDKDSNAPTRQAQERGARPSGVIGPGAGLG